MKFFYTDKKYLTGLHLYVAQKMQIKTGYTIEEIYNITKEEKPTLLRPHVLRIFQELEKKKVLVQNGKFGKQNIYFLNNEQIEK